jgi:hypothetical protein
MNITEDSFVWSELVGSRNESLSAANSDRTECNYSEQMSRDDGRAINPADTTHFAVVHQFPIKSIFFILLNNASFIYFVFLRGCFLSNAALLQNSNLPDEGNI